MKQLLKQNLKKWPKLFSLLAKLAHAPYQIWYWSCQWLIPFRWRQYPQKALHGDRILTSLARELIKGFRPTAIIETGTFKAITTIFLVKLADNCLPVYTCEISRAYFRESRWRLKNMSNVNLSRTPSPAFIKRLIKEEVLGDLPLFYLDAHSGHNLPLLNELKNLATLKKAIIIIDDFFVPGRSDFAFDFCDYGLNKKQPIDLELIKPVLNPNYQYRLFYPCYTEKEAYAAKLIHEHLTGYLLMLVNLESQYLHWKQSSKLIPFYEEFQYP